MGGPHLLTPFIALLRDGAFPLAPTLLPTIIIPMFAIPPTPLISVVILVVL